MSAFSPENFTIECKICGGIGQIESVWSGCSDPDCCRETEPSLYLVCQSCGKHEAT